MNIFFYISTFDIRNTSKLLMYQNTGFNLRVIYKIKFELKSSKFYLLSSLKLSCDFYYKPLKLICLILTQKQVQLKIQNCAFLPTSFCIQNIYIQSQDDVIIYDIQKPLRYIDLRYNYATKVPVVFRDNIGVFNKTSAITVYQDGSQYSVIISQYS